VTDPLMPRRPAPACAGGESHQRTEEPTVSDVAALEYPYVWRWRVRLPERFGQCCQVTARGSLNSVRVEFPDGCWVITSRWAVRRRR
jgi:hypothetical protein